MPTCAVEDFTWADGWVERNRQRKTWGLFGNEEASSNVVKFLLPVWVADVRYSQATGGMFKEGQESRCMAALDACTPDASRVVFVTQDTHPLAVAMKNPGPLQLRTIALPRSTAAVAQKVIEGAARAKQGLGSPKVTLRGLAFVPAVVAEFTSKKGSREIAAGLDGSLPLDPSGKRHLEVAGAVFKQFA
jgi:hypothetical protein